MKRFLNLKENHTPFSSENNWINDQWYQHSNVILFNELRTIYWTEKELLIAIPIILKNGNMQALLDLLNMHIRCTQKHIEHLETVFTSLNPSDIDLKFETLFGNYKRAV